MAKIAELTEYNLIILTKNLGQFVNVQWKMALKR
jgi:hypothetical protein